MTRFINHHRNCHVIVDLDDNTTISLFAPSLNTDYFLVENTHVFNKQFTLTTLLASPKLAYIGDGRVSAEPGGEKIYYQQWGGIATDKESQIVDLLADLAYAYPKIVALGGAAIPVLQPITAKDHPLQAIAGQLLQDAAEQTKLELGAYAVTQLLCVHCLVAFAEHQIEPSSFLNSPLTYYGCRACSQSQKFFQGRAIAVLAQEMAEQEIWLENIVRVNWLLRRSLFDFEAVEIFQATDEEVERFAVQIGNDTDPIRQPRYKEIPCTVQPGCVLSENTIRILERTFGQLEIVKEHLS